MFRDETKKVVRKAKAKEVERNAQESALNKTSRPGSDGSSEDSSPERDIELIIRNPSPPLEDGAIYFFFDHNALVPRTFSRGFLDILPDIYQKKLNPHNPLPEVIAAIGLAGISNLQNAPDAMLAARVKHTAALRNVNSALQNPETAKADSTLMAVMLLGLFENITCSTPQSLEAWAKHVGGATALIQLRGRTQFQYDLGRRMFAYLRIQILVNCLQRRQAVPQVILDWSQTAYNLQNEEEAIEQQLFNLLARLCNIRHLISIQAGESFETVVSALSIDADLEAWAVSLPSVYSYTTIPDKQGPRATFGYSRHVYTNFVIAGIWNAWRSARILTTEAVIAWLTRYDECPQSTPEYIQSELLQTKMSDDICASVSFYFEGTDFRNSPYAVKVSAGVSLLWPLYVVATMFHRTEARTEWVIKQFERIGGVLGIHQATAIANLLKRKREITLWNREMSNFLDMEDENEDGW